MPIRTRFASSPTGLLHLGHIFSAKVARDFAKSDSDGEFLLRFEDIDHTRSKVEYEQSIQTDLQWLSLSWDGPPLRQSTRVAPYRAALDELRDRSLIYPCFATRKELQAEMGAAPHTSSELPYPSTFGKLSEEERRQRRAAGENHCWRLNAQAVESLCGNLEFTDLIHGTMPADPATIGDVVLARKDIGIAYHLAVVIDDAFQEITHVTRGEDLLPFTPIHRILQHLLGLPAPTYLHHRLIRDEQGNRLAKRHKALSISSLREQGHNPSEVLARLDFRQDDLFPT